jgi:hypothetical protein
LTAADASEDFEPVDELRSQGVGVQRWKTPARGGRVEFYLEELCVYLRTSLKGERIVEPAAGQKQLENLVRRPPTRCIAAKNGDMLEDVVGQGLEVRGRHDGADR